MTPDAWWVDPIGGEALGGPVSGSVRARTPAVGPPRIGIDLRIDRAVLARVAAFLPSLAPHLDGFGTFQLSGTLADVFQANIDVAVAQARLAGLPLSELRAPAVLVVTPGSGTGSLRIPRLSARIAGGEVRGDLLVPARRRPVLQRESATGEPRARDAHPARVRRRASPPRDGSPAGSRWPARTRPSRSGSGAG